ncbi:MULTISPECIES: elongation factor P maturation arginine rhamnosyltransferase EarP [unclassified Duganella]|uniref:elongation factor P maturation arginine rhamnosyltransferase EarP n=1 Tax=unclassified Duganella TaxID=2636909 RepID=UPI0006FBDD2A|nr:MULTISPECIES: elongation factor P maturation arginine rhamnosyltransferase EarP [unclassified Duganella]KQV46096.1 epf adjacent protein [Duganella sp. Root336D2]KRB81762.1 epf adjacent protein [Duganella sp. Root198D2]
MTSSLSLHLFCKVVDNFGDIGICWRLSRQLQREHGIAVTLWVDDLRSFQRMCPQVDVTAGLQLVEGITVRHWAAQDGEFTPDDVADIVIEFFACDIPPGYIAAMAQRPERPVWLNLEGLSAEEWVEGCHSLPSKHPRLPLTKYFFFPGFTERTGGLLYEEGLEVARRAYVSDPAAVSAFLSSLGVTDAEAAAIKVSLFCYPYAPVAALFAAWRDGGQPVACLVPEGVASDAVATFLGQPALPGAARSEGALTVRVLPFVPQQDYDRLLWSCDLNFVRGEDSWVRAQWAGKSFIWHIYAQDENLHHKKLRAFLQRYAAGSAFDEFSLCWNGAGAGVGDWPALWKALAAAMPEISAKSSQWQQKILANGDLATNLTKFCASLR